MIPKAAPAQSTAITIRLRLNRASKAGAALLSGARPSRVEQSPASAIPKMARVNNTVVLSNVVVNMAGERKIEIRTGSRGLACPRSGGWAPVLMHYGMVQFE